MTGILGSILYFIVVWSFIEKQAEINSAVLLGVTDSKPVQRLERIPQFGITDELYYCQNYSHYEHYADIMSHLRKLGVSKESRSLDCSTMRHTLRFRTLLIGSLEMGFSMHEKKDQS